MANNRVVHFEIPELFGWKFNKAAFEGPEYWLCDTGTTEPGINGAIMQRQDPRQPTVNYVHVDSIDATIDKATKLGAQVALPKMPIPGVGAVACLMDPQGNLCGLWEKV